MVEKIREKYDLVLADLENFVRKIDSFFELSPSDQIPYFVYFLSIERGKHAAKPIEVEKCFKLLHLSAYSNVSAYLSNGAKGGNKTFVKNSKGYLLERSKRDQIESELNKISPPPPSSDLFPLKLVENTRGYINDIASQALVCYDLGLSDASFVMIRKLLETLIIEVFERHNLQNEITNQSGEYYYLSDLISKLLSHKNWKIGREVKRGLPKIKKLADQSAHNRRFVASKDDIDKLQEEIRLSIQELVSLIDYPSWNKELKSS